MAKKLAKKKSAVAARRAKPRGPAGNWHMDWDPFVKLDAAWTEKVLGMVISPTVAGALDAKTIHLIGLAIDASSTHLYAPGIRRHIQRALDAGATRQELTAVLQLCTLQGLHSICVGGPILLEELERAAADDRLTR